MGEGCQWFFISRMAVVIRVRRFGDGCATARCISRLIGGDYPAPVASISDRLGADTTKPITDRRYKYNIKQSARSVALRATRRGR